VLVYIFLGGLTSAIYNEVLQFFMIVIGFTPLVFLGLKDMGGWSGLKEKLVPVATSQGFAPETWSSSWNHMDTAIANPMGVGWFGMVAGLGFVLSFGYWCTDFLVVQRAMVANSMSAARRTPIIAAFPKMLFPILVIVPGMIAIALHYESGHQFLPVGPDGTPDYNMTVPAMLAHYFPTGLLGLGFTALIASFMAGMAGNVTAFNVVWTYDIYQTYIAANKSDKHYLWMGRWTTVFGILVSIGAAYIASQFNNIMDLLQLVFGFVNAPLFATFLLGMFWKRATGHGAFWGLVSGTGAAILFHGLALTKNLAPGIKGGWINPHYIFQSEMGQNFWMAIIAWTTCFVMTIVISFATQQKKTDAELVGLVYSLTPKPKAEDEPWYQQPAVIGGIVLAVTVILNIIFW
jgi:SSS family solute:Na+ symporter